MPERFDDLPILGEIGLGLRDAMASAAAEPVARRRWRFPRLAHRPLPVVVGALMLAGLGTGTAAATLTVLRGSPIPSPRAADLQPEMTARATTDRVLSLRSSAPGDAIPFALRTSQSQTGLTCVSVGQVRGERFGLTGTDGVYRTMPPTVVDGCGQASDHEVAVVGARTFASPKVSDVRTVIYGIGGPGLRSASVTVRGEERPIEVWHGAFLLALPGYREDSRPTLRLTFADGHTSSQLLGGTDDGLTDPTGPAWYVRMGTPSRADETATIHCVWLGRLRATDPSHHPTPEVCGRANGRPVSRPLKPWFFDIRRFSGDDRGRHVGGPTWSWRGAPSRTIVSGFADPGQVKSITVTAGPGVQATARQTSYGAFAVVLPGSVRPGAIRVRLGLADGTARTFDRPTNLVPGGAPR